MKSSLFYAILVRRAGMPMSVLEALRSPNITDTYQTLQELSHSPILADGLLLSSHNFTSRLVSFQKKEAVDFLKKERQTALKLVEYLTRSAAKTSPLGAFGPVGLYLMVDDLVASGGVNDSFWSVNRRVYSAIWQVLSQRDLNVVDIPYMLNPTIEVIGREYRWLLNRQNREVLQRLEVDETLHLVGHVLYQQTPKPLAEWVEILGKELDVEADRLLVYLQDLAEEGFLVTAPPSSWVSPLCDSVFMNWLLAEPKSEPIESIRKLWRDDATEPQKEGLATMKDRMKVAQDILNEWGEKYAPNWESAAVERVFFNDVSIETEPTTFTKRDVGALTNILSGVLRTITVHDNMAQDKRLAACYKAHFPKADSVSFMDFYEAWFKYGWHEEDMEGPPMATEVFVSFPPGIDLNISLAQLRYWLGRPSPLGNILLPKEVLLQPFVQKDKKCAVVNALHHGFGRLKGRHLHLFDTDVTDAQREWNLSFEKEDYWFAELTDASDFHGNVRPLLLGWELVSTASQTRLWPMSHLPITDLLVFCGGDACRIWNPFLKKNILPFNLDTEALSNRSPMYQLLSLFEPKSPSLWPLISLLRQKTAKDVALGITSWPRITIEKSLVIMRRAWRIEPEIFPKLPVEDAIAFWIKTCRDCKMPDHLFFSMIPQTYQPGPKQSHEKPQYLDLSAPITVELLARNSAKYPSDALWIEEMLPSPDMLETEYATEWVVEFR